MLTEKQSLAQLFWNPFIDFPLFNTTDFCIYVSNLLSQNVISIINEESLHVWQPVRDEVWQSIVSTIQDKHEGILI